jgi:hypothetical protein
MKTKDILPSLGFKMNPPGSDCADFGTQPAEPYNVGKDHFTPDFRSVFVGKAKGGYYVTSHICGNLRRYRCQRVESATVGNIFGGGKTRREALLNFAADFQNKTYNVSR